MENSDVDQVARIVSWHFRLPLDEFHDREVRTRQAVAARSVAMAVLHRCDPWATQRRIAEAMGCTHQTVGNGMARARGTYEIQLERCAEEFEAWLELREQRRAEQRAAEPVAEAGGDEFEAAEREVEA